MKKLLLSLVMVSLVSSCASTKKNGAGDSAGGVVSETTASGSTEKVDSSAMNFSADGSDSGKIEGLKTIHFDYDTANITDVEKQKLTDNVAWLNKYSDAKLLIEGHCDQRGSVEYNLSLGERRANAVKNMLIKMGIKAERLSTTSFGEEKLLATGDSEAEMAQNRRANFVPSR